MSEADKSFRPSPSLPTQIPKEQLASSYARVSGKWVPAEIVQAKRRIVIVERQGSSKAVALVLDPEGPRIPLLAPLFEVLLKDRDGKELDGQEEVLVCQEGNQNYVSATPFWAVTDLEARDVLPFWEQGSDGKPQLNPYLDPNLMPYNPRPTIIIFPYMAVSGQNTPVACSAITHEFVFKLTLDKLSKLKTVEAKVSSPSAPAPDEK